MSLLNDISTEVGIIGQLCNNIEHLLEMDELIFNVRGIEVHLTQQQIQQLRLIAKSDWILLKEAYTRLENLIDQL